MESINTTPKAYIDFEYPGYARAFNWTIELFANGKPVRVRLLRFWQPEEFTFEVPAGEVELKAKMVIWRSKLKLVTKPGEHHRVSLTWNWFTGLIKLHLLK